jgi:hypothetical protein
MTGVREVLITLVGTVQSVVDDLSGETERLRQQLAQRKQAMQNDMTRAEGVKPILPDFEKPMVDYQVAKAKFAKLENGPDPRPALAALGELGTAAGALAGLRARHDVQSQAMSDCADWSQANGAALKEALENKEVATRPQPVQEAHAKLKEADGRVKESLKADFVAARNGYAALEQRLDEFKKALADSYRLGARTGKKQGELEEGWNPKTKKYEYHHPDEWTRMIELAGAPPEVRPSWLQDDKEFPPLSGTPPKAPVDPAGRTQMHKIAPDKVGDAKDVHVKDTSWTAAAEARLRTERGTTTKIREDLTRNLNDRKGKAKEGVKNNCAMASGLAGLLKERPELVNNGGLFGRIIGTVEGQGQHKERNAEKVVDEVSSSAQRLSEGKGQGVDANNVLQFIGCFVDGLTEVNEGKEPAVKQFDDAWPQFQKIFKLKDADKQKLLDRVKGYKELAGAASDTLSGKEARKPDTRTGFMSNDPRKQIEDKNALIKGDISGSMHSCLLAQELAESLMGGGGIKEMGDPVVVKDKELLNARALDALALTAGGKDKDKDHPDKDVDSVFHTAYEMINGMQAISGAPKVSQPIATKVMELMIEGTSFTDAMESIYKDEKLPWQA